MVGQDNDFEPEFPELEHTDFEEPDLDAAQREFIEKKAAEQKAQDIEYHRHAASGYDDAVTRSFHFYHVYSLHRWARQLVLERTKPYVLDMGTGTGVVACTMASFGCMVKAVDHSMDMLAKATARAKFAGVAGNVQFELADCESLTYPDGFFDAVTIQGVLHHLPDFMPTLEQAVRVLKPGGHLYVSEPCAENTFIQKAAHLSLRPLRKILDVIKGRKPEPSVSEHEKPISGPALVAAIQSLGMETQQEFLVQFGAVRFLPERMKIWMILLLSAPTRHKRGNLVFITGRKTALVTRPAKQIVARPANASSRIEVPAANANPVSANSR
jgi:ubiquinone/menaquinone biosynthesis C-methylase UbiE